MDKKKIKLLASYLGHWVQIDESRVKTHEKYSHLHESRNGIYEAQVVAINRINSGSNGYGNNKGELEIFPDPLGHWHSIDLRMIVAVISKPKK